MNIFDKVFGYQQKESSPEIITPPPAKKQPEKPVVPPRTIGNMSTAGEIQAKYDPNVPGAGPEVVKNPPSPMQAGGTAANMAPQEKML